MNNNNSSDNDTTSNWWYPKTNNDNNNNNNKKRPRDDTTTLEVAVEHTISKKSRFHDEIKQEIGGSCKGKGDDLTDAQVIELINFTFGTPYNILSYCGGPGPYLIAGATNTGKTTLIRSLYMTAQLFSIDYGYTPLIWRALLVFSSTDELTKEFTWAEDILVGFPMTEDALEKQVIKRREEMQEGAAHISSQLGTDVTPEQWAKSNPIAIVLDDWNGLVNASHHGNYLTHLATVVRKLGIYLFYIQHGINQCSPTIKDNVRAILTLKYTYDNHDTLTKMFMGRKPHEVISKMTEWNSKPWHVVVYVRQWVLSQPDYTYCLAPRVLLLPPFPMYKERRPIRLDEYRQIRERYNADQRALAEYHRTGEIPEGGLPKPMTLQRIRELMHPDKLTKTIDVYEDLREGRGGGEEEEDDGVDFDVSGGTRFGDSMDEEPEILDQFDDPDYDPARQVEVGDGIPEEEEADTIATPAPTSSSKSWSVPSMSSKNKHPTAIATAGTKTTKRKK